MFRKLVAGFVALVTFGVAVYYLPGIIMLKGEINVSMENKANLLMNFPLPIIVNSKGGDVEAAYRIAKNIQKKGKSIFVIGECSSACSEFFIPAAKKVYISKRALIGFHGSLFFINDFQKPKEYFKIPWCEMEAHDWLVDQYIKKNFNRNFYKETKVRLEYINPIFEFDSNKDCITYTLLSRRNIWYPTSAQLRDLLNFDVSNQICADDEACWMSKIEQRNSRFSYVIGDKVFPVESKAKPDVLSSP